jgi:CubicO group peptidase (beta-lactamase class C family)
MARRRSRVGHDSRPVVTQQRPARARAVLSDTSGRQAIEQAICASPLEYAPRARSVYSDLGYMLLGFILADVAPLEVQFDALRGQMQIRGPSVPPARALESAHRTNPRQ